MEQYERYTHRSGRKVYKLVQYDYRHTDGELFSTVAPTLEEARRRRDEWLESKREQSFVGKYSETCEVVG